MVPLYHDGDFLIVFGGGGRIAGLSRNDPVVVDHPRLGWIVKLVSEVHSDVGTIRLRGLHPLSTPGPRLGPVPITAVKGRVLRVIRAGGVHETADHLFSA